MCKEDGCKTRPIFNFKGGKAMLCFAHKQDGMVDVKNKKCAYENCKTLPIFNFKGGKALLCLTHKQDGMIDVRHKTCKYKDCIIRPTYNIKGAKTALYCSSHKENDMIDVLNKPCRYEGCTIIPNYNIEGKKALYCSLHKTNGMVDVKNKKCIYEGCKIQSNYNTCDNSIPQYCRTHKKNGMIDVRNQNKTCKSVFCSTRVTEKYDNYCLFCYINLFPDKPVSRNYKTKESTVVEFVKTKFAHLTWTFDKTISDGCSKRRPDLLLDLGYQVIIAEVDENKHEGYDSSCENKRLMELSRDVGHRPIVFIRFNPDQYIKDEKNITSCWSINGSGICVVKKSKQCEWTHRLETLESQIKYWSDPINHTSKTIEIIQLFYDS